MWGMPFHLRMKERINRNEIYAPLFFTASPKLTGPEDEGIDKKRVKDPKDGRRLVAKYKEQGYDYIKTYAGLPKDILMLLKRKLWHKTFRLLRTPVLKFHMIITFPNL